MCGALASVERCFLKLSDHGVSRESLVDLGLRRPAAAGVLDALESLDGFKFVPATSGADAPASTTCAAAAAAAK